MPQTCTHNTDTHTCMLSSLMHTHLGQRQEDSLAGLPRGDTLGWHIGCQAETGEGQSGWEAA
eukprot:1137505-Pelagomonas_calceolata.AAC.2